MLCRDATFHVDAMFASLSVMGAALRKKKDRKHQRYRFKELRSFNVSFLVKNGMSAQQV